MAKLGNEGMSEWSDARFKNLRKAIKLIEEYYNIEHQGYQASAKAIQAEIDLRSKIEHQLKQLGVDLREDNEYLKSQYDLEKKIYAQKLKERREAARERREKERERREKAKERKEYEDERQRRKEAIKDKEIEEKFSERVVEGTKKQIKYQQKLNDLRKETLINARNKTGKDLEDYLDSQAEAYRAEQLRQKKASIGQSTLMRLVRYFSTRFN